MHLKPRIWLCTPERVHSGCWTVNSNTYDFLQKLGNITSGKFFMARNTDLMKMKQLTNKLVTTLYLDTHNKNVHLLTDMLLKPQFWIQKKRIFSPINQHLFVLLSQHFSLRCICYATIEFGVVEVKSWLHYPLRLASGTGRYGGGGAVND